MNKRDKIIEAIDRANKSYTLTPTGVENIADAIMAIDEDKPPKLTFQGVPIVFDKELKEGEYGYLERMGDGVVFVVQDLPKKPNEYDIKQLSRISHIPVDMLPKTLVEAYCLGKDHRGESPMYEEPIPETALPEWEKRFDGIKDILASGKGPFEQPFVEGYRVDKVKAFIREEFKRMGDDIRSRLPVDDDEISEALKSRGI